MIRLASSLLALLLSGLLGCASRDAVPPRSAAGGVSPATVLVVLHGGSEDLQLRRLQEIARTYALRPRAAWTMASLGELCALVEAPDRSAESLQALLEGKPGILFSQPVQRFRTLAGAPFDDPYYDLQEGIRDLPLDRIHAHTRGEGVRIALVDTGVDISHPDLSGRVTRASNLAPSAPEAFTADRHGTALAGVIAAQPNNGRGIVGLAPAAELLALKACWYEPGTGDVAICDSYTLARALDAALSAEVDLINLSLTGPPDPLLSRLLDEARRRAVVVVTAVDEARPDGGFPASRPEVLAARGAPAAVSSALSPPEGGSGVWLVGPTIDVLSTAPGGGYDFFSGSSYAAAYVTGIAALLLTQDPSLRGDALVSRLRATARAEGSAIREVLDPCRVLLPDPDPICS